MEEKIDYYDYSLVCTYHTLDSDDLYRVQMLQAFKLDKWNDKQISKITDKLFNIVKNDLNTIFENMKSKKNKFFHMMLCLGDKLTPENLFRILFVYDLYHITHKCISEKLINGKIKDSTLKHLESEIFYLN